MRASHVATAATLVILMSAPSASAQAGQQADYGDAPEGGLAYPGNGVIGQFPTCVTTGPNGWVQHGPVILAYFGAFDLETDGNAGVCFPLAFPPYDQDECLDPDSGLLNPAPFTISGGVVVPCGAPTNPMGPPCGQAAWPTDVDIYLTNMNIDSVYVNILIDWERDGDWTGGTVCGATLIPERALQDFAVPPGFMGPLSLLNPPTLAIGANAGYVWSRFTVTGDTLGVLWDGSGNFEDGESEDYLLLVSAPVSVEESSWGSVKSRYR